MEKKIIIDGVETDYIITDEGIIINSKTNRELKLEVMAQLVLILLESIKRLR